MDAALLQQAQDALRIRDVSLRKSRCGVDDDFDPAHSQVQMAVQLMQRTLRSELLVPDDDSIAPDRLFRVHVELGIRWIRADKKRRSRKSNEKAEPETEKKPEVLAFVEAVFMAEYALTGELEQACLDQFALHNATFNIWSFWREYAVSQAQRMNLPKFVAPLQPLRARAVAVDEVAGQSSTSRQERKEATGSQEAGNQ